MRRLKRPGVLAGLLVCTMLLPEACFAIAGGSYNLSEYTAATGKKIKNFNEAPMLKARVAAGELPPVEKRLPSNPIVMEPWEEIGRYGGTVRYFGTAVGYCHYLRHMSDATVVELGPSSAYHRYSGPGGPILPGVFEAWKMSKDGKTFTFHIRKGLKWSDGVPVTTEDVRYTMEDVWFNEQIVPVAERPLWMKWGGGRTRFEIVDKDTFRLIFAKPYGSYLYDLRNARWHWFMRPKHYLKRFHRRYAPLEKLASIMKKEGYRLSEDTDKDEWGRFYGFIDQWGAAGATVRQPYVTDYPALDPWVVVSQPRPGVTILERNPYFYKVDPEGNQLPYIDRLQRTAVSNLEIINLKVIAGESDVQCQDLKITDYPLFVKSARRGGYEIMLLKAGGVSQLVVLPNLSPDDPVLRKIVQDVRFRRALSLAIHREEIKEAIFLGFGRPAQLTIGRGSVFYEEEFEKPFVEYDPERANKLLDEMGLDKRDNKGIRLRPDGKPLVLQIIHCNVGPAVALGAELIPEYFGAIGIKVPVKEVTRQYWDLHHANRVPMTLWGAGSNVVGMHFYGGFHMIAPMWFDWDVTEGKKGMEPPPEVKRVFTLRDIVQSSASEKEMIKAGKEILRIQAENLWVIGTVSDTPDIFVYSKKFGNISVAEKWNVYSTIVLEDAEQWFFKE